MDLSPLAFGKILFSSVTQSFSSISAVGDVPPTRIDVEVSGGTAAIVQTGANGDGILTFIGCL